MTAGLYVRVSTQEQKKYGISVNNQIDALIEYCTSRGYDYIIYNDAGVSARKKYTRRPALLRLLDDVKEGKIQKVFFTRLDRWFRSVGDYYAVNTVLEEHGVSWKAIWEDYTTENSDGVFKVNIMLSIAQAEADRTSEKIKSVVEYKLSRGDYIGSAPIGYVLTGRDLVVDEGCQEAVQTFWDVLYETKSMAKAREACYDKGLHIKKVTAYKMIKRDVYHGDASNGYKCFAYITKEKHDEILSMVGGKTRAARKPNIHYYFNGLCVCGVCGYVLSAKSVNRTHADGTVVMHKKYLCQQGEDRFSKCPALNISEPKIEKFLIGNLEKLLEGSRITGTLEHDKSKRDYEKEKKNISAKLERLKTLFAEGDLEIEEYRLKRDILKEELITIETELENMNAPELPELPTYWRTVYDSLDEQHKSEFWHNVIKKIVITNETKENPEVIFK